MTAAPPPPPAPPPLDPSPSDPPPSGPPPSDPPPWAPPPWAPPSAPAGRSGVRRSATDKVLGGVCGGLAEYSGIDPLLWRVGFIALAVMGPGLPVYLLLWVFLPGPFGRGRPGVTSGADGVPVAAVPRAPAGPRSPVPGITAAALLIVLGVLVLITRATGWDIGARGFIGAALLVVGLGLVAAAFSGGRVVRGGLIALGVLLSLGLVGASTVPWAHFSGPVGDRSYHPLTAAAVQPTYDAGVGNTTVDLSAVDLAGAPTPIRTTVDGGVGNLHVVVPSSADVQVSVHDGMGNVDVLGNGSTGGFYAGSGSASWTGDGQPEFVLTIDAGIGNVEVDRA
jgi:phage shock protein PspC (stress-responsive transcriptional regulator)